MTSKESSVQDYWDRHSDLFRDYYRKPSWFDLVFRKAIFLRAFAAIDAARELKDPTVLDIGSGPGVNSVALVKKGGARKVTGIDFAPQMIELARAQAEVEQVADKCKFIEGDFMLHKFEPGSFDLVIALGVFDYVEQAGPFLRKMAELARHSVVASWPAPGLRMRLRQLRYSCPVHPYTEEQIRRLHSDADLKSIELMNVPGGWVSRAKTEGNRGRA